VFPLGARMGRPSFALNHNTASRYDTATLYRHTNLKLSCWTALYLLIKSSLVHVREDKRWPQRNACGREEFGGGPFSLWVSVIVVGVMGRSASVTGFGIAVEGGK
jgi:hypothetical protein